MNQSVFEIEHLSKRYPQTENWAVHDVTLNIRQGEIFGLLGDNGAGKSTLVKQMVGLLKPTQGSIKFCGRSVDAQPETIALNVGYMPQKTNSLNQMTVNEALFYTSHLRGLSRREAKQEVRRLIKLWQIENIENVNNRNLSGGQRRLLYLAVATAGRPPVIILDEPTNDLDPLRRNLVWSRLRQLNREEGTTIIFITHDAVEAEKIIQRVGIMRSGSLLALGRPQALKKVIDHSLRLDLFFDPDQPPQVPAGLNQVMQQDGHWRYLVDWDEAPKLMNKLNLDQIDDFRLNSASLEDLYLYYAGAADDSQ
ncbi:MAG: ABC transporter ATP-binding protein [Chloroflexota bacterium]